MIALQRRSTAVEVGTRNVLNGTRRPFTVYPPLGRDFVCESSTNPFSLKSNNIGRYSLLFRETRKCGFRSWTTNRYPEYKYGRDTLTVNLRARAMDPIYNSIVCFFVLPTLSRLDTIQICFSNPTQVYAKRTSAYFTSPFCIISLSYSTLNPTNIRDARTFGSIPNRAGLKSRLMKRQVRHVVHSRSAPAAGRVVGTTRFVATNKEEMPDSLASRRRGQTEAAGV